MIQESFLISKQLDASRQTHLPWVTLFRICRIHPSIFCISTFCTPFSCQHESVKPRTLSPSSMQWECRLNDKALPPREHQPRIQKIHKNQSRPAPAKDVPDHAPHRAAEQREASQQTDHCGAFASVASITAPLCHW